MSYTFEKEQEKKVEDGTYECIIDKIELKATYVDGEPTKKRMQFTFKIREDIGDNGKFKKWFIYDTAWWDDASGQYNAKKLGDIVNAIYRDEDTINFSGENEIMEYLLHKAIRITLTTKVGKDLKTRQYPQYKKTQQVAKVVSNRDFMTDDEQDLLPF